MRAAPASTSRKDAELPSAQGEIAQELGAVAADIEREFLAVGDCLIGAIGLFDEMRKTVEASAETLTGEGLNRGIAILSSLPGRLREVAVGLEEEDTAIASVAAAVMALDRPFSSLATSTRIIEAVAINARIVSAGTLDIGATDLGVFTEDVVELSREAVATVKSLRGEEDALNALVREARERSRKFRQAFEVLGDGAAASLDDALERFAGHAAKEGRRSGEISEAIGARSAALAVIVPALQVGDATRQRLEHVVSAMALAMPSPSLLALQRLQLDAARDDLVQDTAVVGARLRATLDEAAATFRLFTKSDDAGAIRSLVEVVGRLVASLREAAEEHERNRALKEAIEASVASIGTHATTMQDLEFSMRMVSLNTAISCSRLGTRGRALSAISLQLRELVGEMLARSEDATATSDALGAASSGIGTTGKDENDVAAIASKAAASLTTLRRGLADHGAGLAEASRVTGKINTLLKDAEGALARQGYLGNRLAACVEALGEELEGAYEGTASDLLPEIEQALAAAYTMDAEREVHAIYFGRPPIVSGENDVRGKTDLAGVLF